MSKLQIMKLAITQTAGRTGLVLRKFAPEILVGTGIVGVITSTVMACRATTKAEDIMDETKERLDNIHLVHATETAEKYTEKDYQKDLIKVYYQTGVKFAKAYGPAITLGLVSIGCILGGYNVLRKRNVALMAAYKAVEESYAKYRKRVIEEYGEEKDKEYRTGIRHKLVDKVDENGNPTGEKVVETTQDPNGISEYARYFNKSCKQWSPIPDYNFSYLKMQQGIATDILQSRGHLFLNEVYDMLGIDHSTAGAVVGWVKGYGDDFVDFGIFNKVDGYRNDKVCDSINEEREDFVNGYKDSVLLDFNVSGVMYDKI